MAKKDDKDNGKIYGTEGADVIDAKGGNDKVYGLGGDDTLIGGSGNDELEGGEGAGDRLFGESGNDKLDDDDGVETASGGSGNDQINILFSNTLSAPQTVVTGDEGNDTIRLNFVGQDISTLRVAGDTVIGAEGQDDDQGGNDSIIFSGSWLGGDTAIVNLNGGNDRFTSTSEDSGIAVYGGAGNDTLIGGGGDDLLAGGTGTDFLVGNGGNDTLVYARDAVWGSGWSALNVSSGERVGVQGLSRSYDTFDGGDGYDLLVLRAGDDALFLDDPYSEGLQNTPRVSGIEIIYAGDGNDVVDLTSDRFSYGAVTLMGEGGDDVLWSSGGNDSLFGGDGNDSLDGGAGDDNLTGGLGNDTLRGGAGNDILYSDAGDDVLAGGAGSDTYVFEAGFGADTLHDTAEGADVKIPSSLAQQLVSWMQPLPKTAKT